MPGIYENPMPPGLVPSRFPIRGRARTRRSTLRDLPMLDIILIAVGTGLFLVGIAYAYACDRL